MTDRISIFEMIHRNPPYFLKIWEILLKISLCSAYANFDILAFARQGCSLAKEKFPSGLVITAKLSYGKFSLFLPELMVQREEKTFPTLIFHPVFSFRAFPATLEEYWKQQGLWLLHLTLQLSCTVFLSPNTGVSRRDMVWVWCWSLCCGPWRSGQSAVQQPGLCVCFRRVKWLLKFLPTPNQGEHGGTCMAALLLFGASPNQVPF